MPSTTIPLGTPRISAFRKCTGRLPSASVDHSWSKTGTPGSTARCPVMMSTSGRAVPDFGPPCPRLQPARMAATPKITAAWPHLLLIRCPRFASAPPAERPASSLDRTLVGREDGVAADGDALAALRERRWRPDSRPRVDLLGSLRVGPVVA